MHLIYVHLFRTCGFKHYENTPIQIYWKFHHQKLKVFRKKKSDIFHISAQNINCGYSLEPPRRGGSNEYPQSMYLSRNKKNNVYPCKPQFYYIKVGLRGSELYRYVFVMMFQLCISVFPASKGGKVNTCFIDLKMNKARIVILCLSLFQ